MALSMEIKCVHKGRHVCMYVCTYVCRYVRTSVCLSARMPSFPLVRMSVRQYVCVSVCRYGKEEGRNVGGQERRNAGR